LVTFPPPISILRGEASEGTQPLTRPLWELLRKVVYPLHAQEAGPGGGPPPEEVVEATFLVPHEEREEHERFGVDDGRSTARPLPFRERTEAAPLLPARGEGPFAYGSLDVPYERLGFEALGPRPLRSGPCRSGLRRTVSCSLVCDVHDCAS
jgi:hypothetical protein